MHLFQYCTNFFEGVGGGGGGEFVTNQFLLLNCGY